MEQQTMVQQRMIEQGNFESRQEMNSTHQQAALQQARPPLHASQQHQYNSLAAQQSSQSFVTREVAKGKEYTRVEDEAGYISSLHPTATGDNIRQGGDAVFAQSAERRDVRDNGLFGGIAGDNNSLVDESEYEKRNVKDLVGHFSKVRPKMDIPAQVLPQQHNIGTGAAPSLNYLCQEQNVKQEFKKQESHTSNTESVKTMQQQQSSTSVSSYQSQQVQSSSVVQQNTERHMEKHEESSATTERRQSLKDLLLMDPATSHMNSGFIDPSAILRESDGSNGRSQSEGNLRQSSIEGWSENTNKWDNHNAIARGWGGMKEKYHPVTFREIYNVDSQAPPTSHNL